MAPEKQPTDNGVRGWRDAQQTAAHGQNYPLASPNIALNVKTNEPRTKAAATTEILEAIVECLPPKQSPPRRETIRAIPQQTRGSWLPWAPTRAAFFTKLDVYVEGAMNDAPTTATQFARSLATPVSLNPCLLLVHAGNPSAAAFSGRWNRMDPHGFATVLPGWSGHQHGNSYFADAPCLEVDVSLRIALGPDTLRVSTTVEQDTALTIKDAISGALIAQSCLELYHDEEEQLYTTVYGVPAEIISEMECGLECEAVLDLAECQSGLLGLTSPTDRERADVERLPKMIKFHRSIRRLSGQRRSTPLSRGAMPTWHFGLRNM